jgi:folate-binding protein YgfZ
MKKTPLYSLQQRAGAAFVPLFQWQVADTFGHRAAEYRAAQAGAALLDASYNGRFLVTGKDALDLLNRLSTNKVDELPLGTGAGTVLATNKGRVIDLLHIFALEDGLLMLTSPQTRQRVVEWIDQYTFLEDVTLEDVTETTAMLSVLGPQAPDVLERVTGVSVTHLGLYEGASFTLQGTTMTVLRTGPIGLPGYSLVVSAAQAESVWSALAAPAVGATPIGEGTFNALRVEAGLPRHRWELSERVNPWEVNLREFIHFEKGCYIGQEVILRLNTYNKVQRSLVALTISSPGAEEGDSLRHGDKDAGRVTSVVVHPISGEHIGLGLVRTSLTAPGTELEAVSNRDLPAVKATVRALPVESLVLSS